MKGNLFAVFFLLGSSLSAQSFGDWFMGRTDLAPVASVSSTAELVETQFAGDYLYPPAYVLDGVGETTWCPGGDGVKQSLTIGFGDAVSFDEIQIVNGFAGKNDLYTKNNRIKTVQITQVAGKHFQNKAYSLVDNQPSWQSIKFDLPQTSIAITFTILEVYKGKKYNDTCLSDIRFLWQGKVIPYQGADNLIKVQVAASKEQVGKNSEGDFRKFYLNQILQGENGNIWLFTPDQGAYSGEWDSRSNILDYFSHPALEIKGNRLVLRSQVGYVESVQTLLFKPDGAQGLTINGVYFKATGKWPKSIDNINEPPEGR